MRIGDRQFKLTLGEEIVWEGSETRYRRFNARCDCGNTIEIALSEWQNQTRKSCGCDYNEPCGYGSRIWAEAQAKKKADAAAIIVQTSSKVRTRDEDGDKKSDYPFWRYWKDKKDVYFHPEWRESYQLFSAYIGPRPSKGHKLIRHPDPKGAWEPGNVTWYKK